MSGECSSESTAARRPEGARREVRGQELAEIQRSKVLQGFEGKKQD